MIEGSPVFVSRPGILERVATIAALFVFAFSLPTDWLIRTNNPDADLSAGGGAMTQLVFLMFLGVAVLALNGNWPVVILALKREPLIPALIALATLSSVWATNFFPTLQNGIVLGVTAAIGYHLATRFEIGEVLLFTGIALAIGLFTNYAFIFIFGEFGLDTINVGTDGGAKWSGVFTTKNELGRIACLSVLVFGFLTRIRRSLIVWPLLTLLAAIQVLGSDSATSLGATGGLAVLAAVFLGFRGRKTLYGATAMAYAMVFSALTLLAATNLVVATGLLGKDSNFTGRLPLWQHSFEYGISRRPWFGYGWLDFWGFPDVDFDVQLRTNFNSPHAHNAFVDIWLYVGPLGAAILALIFARALIWGARNIRANPTAIGLAPIMLVSYAFIFSLTEAGVIRRDISFILFIVACTAAASNKGIRRPFLTRKTESPPVAEPAPVA